MSTYAIETLPEMEVTTGDIVMKMKKHDAE